MPKTILKIEGFIFFVTALIFYFLIQGNWLLFIVLFFVPDISIIGYLKDKKIGAVVYNVVHNYILAMVLIGIGLFLENKLALEVGVILAAHVSLDRMLGFGLKYPTDFKDTHIQEV